MPDDITSSPEQGAASQEPEQGKNSVQQRIDVLVKQARSSERENESLRSENAALTDKLTELTTKVEALINQPKAEPATETPAKVTAAEPLTADSIGKLVAEKIGEVLGAHSKKATEEDMLKTAQQDSFVRASQVVPKLADRNSDEFQLFAQIFNNRPELNTTPDGPELTVEIVKSLMADRRSADRQTDQRKTDASVRSPQSVAANYSKPGDFNQAMEAKQKLLDKGKTQGFSNDEFEDFIRLSLATSRKPE
jgi:hypothetical protein